jgi:hypothetical protein
MITAEVWKTAGKMAGQVRLSLFTGQLKLKKYKNNCTKNISLNKIFGQTDHENNKYWPFKKFRKMNIKKRNVSYAYEFSYIYHTNELTKLKKSEK